MKFATFVAADGKPAIGIVDAGKARILDVREVKPEALAGRRIEYRNLVDLIRDGASSAALRAVPLARLSDDARWLGLGGLTLLAPLPVPEQIRDCSVFERHIRDGAQGMAQLQARLGKREIPRRDASAPIPEVYARQPIYYISNRFSVVGPDAVVQWPGYSSVIDFELEIAVIIGKRGKNIPVEDAASYIYGYSIFNDFSARDQQGVEMRGGLGPTKGKSFDGGNALGPWIVTPDEIGDAGSLGVKVVVDGEEWSRSTTAGMLHSFEQMIAFISRDETLHPGEVIASGTVGGCCGLELNRFPVPGSTVELVVDRIGTLRNRIAG